MILGYNQPRPTAENYQDFMEKLIAGLEDLGRSDLSLMLSGSYVRGDYTLGRSDIDAVMIFPHDVVIDKECLRYVSTVIHHAMKGNHVPFQLSPLDATIVRDGRFNSFTDDWYDYFQTDAKVILGPDYRGKMVCLRTKTGEESTLSHNLRKSRLGHLFSEYDRHEDYERFLERFNTTLNAASRGSKQILFLADGVLRKNRFYALAEIPNFFPEVDTEPLRRIRDLFCNPEKLDALYRRPDDVMVVWDSAETFFEEMIRAYIRRFPSASR